MSRLYSAILLAKEDWIKVASEQRTKIYDFIMPKGPRFKGRITKLKAGSVCIILKYPPPNYFAGEFTVEKVKELDYLEYNKVRSLIYNPESLTPEDKRWVIFFKDFRYYPKLVAKKECSDIRTSTSKKPLSEWIVSGFSLIKPEDFPVIEHIREKVQPELATPKKRRKLTMAGLSVCYKN